MTGIDDTLAADLAALGNASVVPEDQGALVYARAFVQEVINDDAGDDPDPQWVYDRLVESLAVIENLTAALPFLTAAPSAATARHERAVAYADDVAEGGAPVPDDYERHYCTDDGEDWPCGAARAARVPETMIAALTRAEPSTRPVSPPRRSPPMSTQITPDERAAMRERYAADLPSAWDTSAAAYWRVLRDLGTSARNDVPRLLDALDTAEAAPTGDRRP